MEVPKVEAEGLDVEGSGWVVTMEVYWYMEAWCGRQLHDIQITGDSLKGLYDIWLAGALLVHLFGQLVIVYRQRG